MLENFRKAKEPEIANLRQNGVPAPFAGSRPDFQSVLQRPGIAVIAEYKRASPSRGLICESVDVDEACAQYAAAGAAALSILTETDWFGGKMEFIGRAASTGLPILRKDFIFDESQVRATAASPASALLLIVRQTPDAAALRDLRKCAESFGMDAVAEVFDAREVEIARQSGAKIIQVNARDLQKLQVDRAAPLAVIGACGKLPGEAWIAASGIETNAHLQSARKAGFDAALIGTALMRGGKPGAALRELLGRE